MNYKETIEYLYNSLPMYHKIGTAAYKEGLENIVGLCEALGNPQNKFKCIHVAGTNGKGSTSHMLASILKEAGYKTGLFTSPHLKQFTERIKVNGAEISPDKVVHFVNHYRPSFEHISPSFFEMTVAMAFDHFAEEKVDVAIIEAGLGGRLDSTNLIHPILSIITNISYDHMAILGNTLEKIAYEKAGIIKELTPIVVSERQKGIDKVFESTAMERKAKLHFGSDKYTLSHSNYYEGTLSGKVLKDGEVFIENIKLPLGGLYQSMNLAGVLQGLEILKELNFNVSKENIKNGLEKVVSNTGLKGRWQILGSDPLIICDTGHNEAGISAIVSHLKTLKYRKLYMVLGMVNDKDISTVLEILPKEAYYVFSQANIPRALDAHQLYEKAKTVGMEGEVVRDVNAGIKRVKELAGKDDLIFIGGSTFVVAEIENL